MDSTTIVLVLALGNLAFCAALFFSEQRADSAPGRPEALTAWGWSRQMQAAGWLLLAIGASGVVPDRLALPIAYALVIAGVAWEAGALWERGGSRRWRKFTTPALALAAFLLCYWIDEIGLRALAASLILGAFYLSAAGALARGWREASMLRRFLALAVALLALVVGARGALVLLAPSGWGWMSNELLRQLYSGALYLLMLLGGFGWLLLGRERLQDELARLEVIDPLLEVVNRRGFFGALAPWMALARRPGAPTALVLFDLDQFKRVNDSYGHPAGDVVLRTLVDVCKRQLRDSDQLGRLVGVEFAILLPRTSEHDAAMVAERMRAAIAATKVKTERAMISLTASFGVTTIRADDSSVTLLARADEALRAAKNAGRNRIELAPPPAIPAEV
jgi:diguanylate cyclase (GGDEF)-like protein